MGREDALDREDSLPREDIPPPTTEIHFSMVRISDLGSAPTTLEGGRVVDAYECFYEYSQTSDALQAVCKLPRLSKVWVTPPTEAMFDPGGDHRDPVAG